MTGRTTGQNRRRCGRSNMLMNHVPSKPCFERNHQRACLHSVCPKSAAFATSPDTWSRSLTALNCTYTTKMPPRKFYNPASHTVDATPPRGPTPPPLSCQPGSVTVFRKALLFRIFTIRVAVFVRTPERTIDGPSPASSRWLPSFRDSFKPSKRDVLKGHVQSLDRMVSLHAREDQGCVPGYTLTRDLRRCFRRTAQNVTNGSECLDHTRSTAHPI
jgi:hypothetical protein